MFSPFVLPVVLLHTATANGFQMVTSGAQSKAVSDWAITSLEVRDWSRSLQYLTMWFEVRTNQIHPEVFVFYSREFNHMCKHKYLHTFIQ